MQVLWPAGAVLALWVAEHCVQLKGLRVLELGAGVGAPSALAAACQAQVPPPPCQKCRVYLL